MVGLLAVSGLTVGSLMVAPAAEAASPTVTCTTNANIFNTGYNAATGGVLPNDAKDANWEVSGPVAASATVAMPPANATWVAANVANIVPAAWSPSPYGNAQWISQQTVAHSNQGPTGDWYYRYQFNLDSSVSPQVFSLAMSFMADNSVAEVFINGVPQSAKTRGLPQTPLTGPTPSGSGSYYYQGFKTPNASQTTLNHDWQAGSNTIVVQIKSAPGAEGFLAQIRPSSVCLPPTVALTKTATVSPAADQNAAKVGDTIAYSFAVTNTGTSALANVAVTDPSLGPVTCPVITAPGLQQGSSVTCTSSSIHTVTQADVDAGGAITNTATATGTNYNNDTSTPVSATAAVPTSSENVLTLLKHAGTPVDANGDGLVDAGDTISYTFTVTNAGQLTVSNVKVVDQKVGAVNCPQTSLGAGASELCTGAVSYEVTSDDVAAKAVNNTAIATGATPTGGAVQSAPSNTSTPAAAPTPGLSITKSASPSSEAEYTAGQLITYTFVVRNTGNVQMNDISVDDSTFSGTDQLSPIDCSVTSLAPGDFATCTATYTLTQGDVNALHLTNAATATGTPVAGGGPITTTPSTVTIPVDPAPAISLTKSAKQTTVANVGDTIDYTFQVTNTGNVSLTDPTIDETSFSGTGGKPQVSCPTGVAILPGQSAICTARYSVTQPDIDAATITNTATASATPSTGSTAPISEKSTASVAATQAGALALIKSSQLADTAKAGSTVKYSFQVTNTGNVTVSGIKVTDSDFSGTGTLGPIDCPQTTLTPGDNTMCTADYTLTQDDVAAGLLTNTATVAGTTRAGDTVTSPEADNRQLLPSPALSLVKSATPTAVTAAGEVVHYSFEVTNTGNVTVNDASIKETDFSGAGFAPEATCPVGPIAPKDSVTCTADYTVVQADVDAGAINNTATATAAAPGDDPDPVSAASTATVSAVGTAALSLTKSSALDGEAKAGDTVTYTFVVANIGTLTVSGIKVTDLNFSGTGTLGAIDCPATTVAPADTVSCTAHYKLSQADVDAGHLSNSATAAGTTLRGDPVDALQADNSLPLAAAPALTVVKSANPAAPADFKAGEQITYSFVITNTGNVTLSGVKPVEGTFTGTGSLDTPTCPVQAPSLAPGDQVTCTTIYTVTQGDVDAGSISNTAAAEGTPPQSATPVPSDPFTVTVPEPAKPADTVVKTADVTTITKAGQKVTYTFTVTNTGNTTLTHPVINEGAFTGHGTLSPVVCPTEPAQLVPGQKIECTADYEVVAADLSGKPLSNTATATATPPFGDPIGSEPSTARIDSVSPPATARPAGLASTGSSIPAGLVATALALLGAGALMLLVRRRKPSNR